MRHASDLAENEEGASMVLQGIGPQVLLHHLASSLQSTDENVVLQVRFIPLILSIFIHLTHVLV